MKYIQSTIKELSKRHGIKLTGNPHVNRMLIRRKRLREKLKETL